MGHDSKAYFSTGYPQNISGILLLYFRNRNTIKKNENDKTLGICSEKVPRVQFLQCGKYQYENDILFEHF
jgi:hypothetical protein